MVELRNVTKFYGEFKALDNIDFELPQTGILGLLGKNGAGKSTCMKILAGVVSPDEGSYFFDSQNVGKDRSFLWKKQIGYLPDVPPIYEDLSVIDNLQFWAEIKKMPKISLKNSIDLAVDRCGLGSVKNKFGGSLSKGFRQRLGLAQAIVNSPKFLILDEPASGLDPQQNVEMRELILELGKEHCILFSTHLLNEVQLLCSQVLVLHEGRLISNQLTKNLDKLELSRKLVRLNFLEKPSDRQVDELSRSFPVNKVIGDDYFLELEKDAVSIEKLQSFCRSHGLLVVDMEWCKVDIEQMFLNWMEDKSASTN